MSFDPATGIGLINTDEAGAIVRFNRAILPPACEPRVGDRYRFEIDEVGGARSFARNLLPAPAEASAEASVIQNKTGSAQS